MILSFILTTTIAFGQYYQRPFALDYEECPNCQDSDWYIGNNAGWKSEPRPSKWGQHGFSNAWRDEDFPDEAEQDDISGFERSVYVDHK